MNVGGGGGGGYFRMPREGAPYTSCDGQTNDYRPVLGQGKRAMMHTQIKLDAH